MCGSREMLHFSSLMRYHIDEMNFLVGGFQKHEGEWETEHEGMSSSHQWLNKYQKGDLLMLPAVIKYSKCTCSISICVQDTSEVRSSGSSVE